MGDPGIKLNGLTVSSYISFGLLGMVIAATIWIKDGQNQAISEAKAVKEELLHYKELQTINAQLVGAKIDGLGELVKIGAADRYTATDAQIFAERLQELNPNLKVPRIAHK